ncbi:hypothetical protein AVEN_76968-1 [Araneus ventricosus]|uniref:Uncharacterized protein n=1 Tax=Araneus ventricosus TaxID=182803 RepID=A0A4Y2FZE3_ARAVE|nr:hypothetical protein AVEN_244141-1 [Araneus ventricosus]GBO23856.1 hypothetical protein AVEN_76968-1 [Araneus ventricosus]
MRWGPSVRCGVQQAYIHDGPSVESGLEPGNPWPRSLNLTTSPPRSSKGAGGGDTNEIMPLGIPTTYDSVCQQAMLNRQEPIFEPLDKDTSDNAQEDRRRMR